METNDYRQQPWMRHGAKGRAQQTTSMCPGCGAEPKFPGQQCETCGCMEAVIVYIHDLRHLQRMIADYDRFLCGCFGERTRQDDEAWGDIVATYYDVEPPSLFERMNWQDRKAFEMAVGGAEVLDQPTTKQLVRKYAGLIIPVML